MSEVVWKTIPGYADYEASDTGLVRRIRGGRGEMPRILNQHKDNLGYMRTHICRECKGPHDIFGNYKGARLKVTVHRLVAAAWFGRCPKGMEVNHKDMNKANNNIRNLEYVTHKENLRKAMEIKGNWAPRGEAHHNFGKSPSEETRQKMRAAKMGSLHWRSTKVNPADVIRLKQSGMNEAVIAATLGVKRCITGSILRGTHWSVRGSNGPFWKNIRGVSTMYYKDTPAC